nr:MFS transporter [Heliobacterium chlorum]
MCTWHRVIRKEGGTVAEQQVQVSTQKWHRFGVAFSHRNYRLFFAGQAISVIGTWVQRTALSWLVYRLTNSVLMLGLLDFAGQIPFLFLAPVAGVLVDRWNRYRIVVAAQVLSMLQAGILAYLVLTDTVQVWHVLLLTVFIGLVNAFEIPSRQSFVIEMVEDKAHLSNAIALNSAMFNSARIIGPSVAGVAIATLGEGLCFFLNALSYIAVIAGLLMMKVNPIPRKISRQRVWNDLMEGLRYVNRIRTIRAVLLLMVVLSIAGMPVMVLLPVIVRNAFEGGPQLLGFFMATFGLGALAGTFFLASRRNTAGLQRLIPMACGLFGCGLMVFSLSRSLWLTFSVALTMGLGMVVQTASTNTFLQSVVDEDKRGRVISLYVTSFGGLSPIGSYLAGHAADVFGVSATLFTGGLVCLMGALFFLSRLPAWRQQPQEAVR